MQHLYSGSRWSMSQGVIFVGSAGCRPAQLAARGLENGVRNGEHHFLRRLTNTIYHALRDSRLELRSRCRIREPCFSEHDESFGRRRWLRQAKRHYATLADSVQITYNVLDLVRIDMLPATDDDVLDATGDIQLALGQVRAISSITPGALYQFRGCIRVLKVSGCCRRTSELQDTLDPFRDFQAGIVDDSHAVAWKWATAGHESKHVRGALRLRYRPSFAGHRRAIHTVDNRTAPHRWNRQPHSCFRQSEYRSHCLRSQAVWREPLAKPLHSVRRNRLSAIERNAQ